MTSVRELRSRSGGTNLSHLSLLFLHGSQLIALRARFVGTLWSGWDDRPSLLLGERWRTLEGELCGLRDCFGRDEGRWPVSAVGDERRSESAMGGEMRTAWVRELVGGDKQTSTFAQDLAWSPLNRQAEMFPSSVPRAHQVLDFPFPPAASLEPFLQPLSA